MGRLYDLARHGAWRLYETDGVSSSGKHAPKKLEVWDVFEAVDDEFDAVDGEINRLEGEIAGAAQGLVQADTLAQLNATPGTREGQPGRVLQDGNNAGEYRWNGSSWVRIGPLLDARAATADAELVQADVRPPRQIFDGNNPSIVGGAVRSIDGREDSFPNSVYRASNWMIVRPGGKITFTRGPGSGVTSDYGVVFYNALRSFISSAPLPGPWAVRDVPADAVYARFTYNVAVTPSMEVYDADVSAPEDRPRRHGLDQVRARDLDLIGVSLNGVADAGQNVFTLQGSEPGALLVDSGEIDPAHEATWTTSDYLPIRGVLPLFFSNGLSNGPGYGIVYYDVAQQIVGSRDNAIVAGVPYYPPYNAAFVRVTGPNAQMADLTMRVGRAAAGQPGDVNGVAAPQWFGKTAINLGDSISADTNWFGTLCAHWGMTQKLNASRSGRTLVHGLYRADDTTPLEASDFEGVDLCFMLLGTNNSLPIGSLSDGTTAWTFYGHLRRIVEQVLTWQPEIRFVISTLIWRGNQVEFDERNDAIRSVAADYAIPLCDLRVLSGFSELNDEWAMPDRLHPSALGYRRCLLPATKGFLRGIDPVLPA